MRCCEAAPSSNWRNQSPASRQEAEPSSRAERRPREGVNDGADFVACGRRPAAISTKPLHAQLTPSSAKRARRERRRPKASNSFKTKPPTLDPIREHNPPHPEIRCWTDRPMFSPESGHSICSRGSTPSIYSAKSHRPPFSLCSFVSMNAVRQPMTRTPNTTIGGTSKMNAKPNAAATTPRIMRGR